MHENRPQSDSLLEEAVAATFYGALGAAEAAEWWKWRTAYSPRGRNIGLKRYNSG